MEKLKYAALAFILFSSMNAQDRKIEFEHSSWKQAVAKAKKQNKLIFVDCYTTWCGPCKQLTKEVFTKNEVADYFNKNFINVKMDMEQKLGESFKKPWNIRFFPTLIFINPNNVNQPEHTIVGFYREKELLAYSDIIDPNNRYINLEKSYKQGKRDGDFMFKYLRAIRLAKEDEKEMKVASAYFEHLPKEDLLKKENWNIIRYFLKDPLSDTFKYLLEHNAKLKKIIDPLQVESKFYNVYRELIKKYKYWYYQSKPFPEGEEKEVIEFLEKSNYSRAPEILTRIYAIKYQRQKNIDLYCKTISDMIQSESKAFSASEILSYARPILQLDDKGKLNQALDWLNYADKIEPRPEHRIDLLKTKSEFFKKLGKLEEAKKADEDAKKADEEATQSGKKIFSIPAVKMK